MILKFLAKLTELSPWFRRKVWHRWYQYLAGYQMEQWKFMNYGYVAMDDASTKLELEPADEQDRLATQLYHHVASGVDLNDRDVLEVGCGRGGGASFVARYHCPRKLTALDFSRKAIELCQKNNRTDNLEFAHGNAEALPFEPAKFDAVLNVESSHCYGSMPTFLAEVHRVLNSKGYFLFADFRTREGATLLDKQTGNSGLAVVEKTDITVNVLESMRLDNDRKLKLINRWGSKRLSGTIRQFAGVEGSEIHEGFRNGEFVYLYYVLQKP